MAITKVYASNETPAGLTLAVSNVGPRTLTGVVNTSNIAAGAKRVKAVEIPRAVNGDYFIVDVAFAADGVFLAALQVMLRGHGTGSTAWWRWRTAQRSIGFWYGDHADHGVAFSRKGKSYEFVIAGEWALGYDDVATTMKAG